MEKLDLKSFDRVQGNIEWIRERFPNVVTEVVKDGKTQLAVDFEALKQELSSVVTDEKQERYQFTWPDKSKAKTFAAQRVTSTLRPCVEESVNFDTTQNLYIEGDNLEVLKLLQETYLCKVKMIYIDPPYNTGNDFVYNDYYKAEASKEEGRTDFRDEHGNILWNEKQFCKNPESNGRFHTDWLNMIYPRLKVAKDLLTDDGVIFISIDDNEQENLKKICDEIFGESNFITQFPRVTKKGGKSTDTYAKNHDYIICYCKNKSKAVIKGVAHKDAGFCNKDEYFETRGYYKLNQTLDYNTLQYNKSMDYPIEIDGKVFVPGGDIELQKQRHSGIHGKHDWVWRWSKDLFDFGYKNGWIEISKSGRIYTKTYLNASIISDINGYRIEYNERTKPVSTLEFVENQYSNDNSNKEISGLMGAALFDYVKSTNLITMLMRTATEKDSIILDFFSGSATTAHAVMQLNAEDGGNRKFIMVQLPEVCDETSEAYKAGFKNICEIGKERIRRAGAKIKEMYAVNCTLDTGFRVLKLDSSNMRDVYYNPTAMSQSLLDSTIDNVKPDRTPLDLLFQVMLDLGVELSAKIEEKTVNGKKYFKVNNNDLIACFDDNIDNGVITEIAKLTPLYAVFKDKSFATDSVGINYEQLFKTYSPSTIIKVI